MSKTQEVATESTITNATFDADTLTRLSLHARTTITDAVQMIPVADLFESPLNPRQYYPEAGLNELADSMRASGFRAWLPIVGRPRPEGGVEIAAGHRRSRAAKLAGLTEVPCVVREMTDAEFLDILNFDNSGREDVHPLHEAAGWADWLKQDGRTVIDIAHRIGKSKEYVYKRLLVVSMIDAAKKAYLDGKITLGHAEIIARCNPRDQARVLQHCEPPLFNPSAPPISTRDLKQWVDRNLNCDLTLAPFSRTDADLVPEAGACGPCLKRLGNFEDFDAFEEDGQICTDGDCHQRKVAAWIEAEKPRMEAEFGYLLLVSSLRSPQDLHAIRVSEWHHAQRDSPAAKTALMIDGDDAGKRVQVFIQEKLPIEPPAPIPAKAPKAAVPKVDSKQAAEEKARRDREIAQLRQQQRDATRQREEVRVERERERAVRKALLKAVLAKVAWPPTPESVGTVLEDWLDSSLPDSLDDLVFTDGVENVRARRDWSKVSATQIARIVAIIHVADDFDDYALGHGASKLEAQAKRYGVDLKAVRKRATLQDIAASVDLEGDSITYTPSKGILAEIKFRKDKEGPFATYAISLPVKAGEGHGESGPVVVKAADATCGMDRGAAIDAAFSAMLKVIAKVPSYAPATDATREAAEEVKHWVKAGQAARAAQRELAALDAPMSETRTAVVAKLPTLGAKKPAPAKKAPARKAAKKSAKKGGKK